VLLGAVLKALPLSWSTSMDLGRLAAYLTAVVELYKCCSVPLLGSRERQGYAKGQLTGVRRGLGLPAICTPQMRWPLTSTPFSAPVLTARPIVSTSTLYRKKSLEATRHIRRGAT
jgi:hypothetical protein